MRIVMFYHSLLSDWNNGNAHFLRGVVSDLKSRGHDVRVYEEMDAWSYVNLYEQYGDGFLRTFNSAYPGIESIRYDPRTLDIGQVLDGADLVMVHEWNDPGLVQKIGKHRKTIGGYMLLFHDTGHRSVTDSESIAAYDLSNYDGVLAFGEAIRRIYLFRDWAEHAWTWHEAADVRIFRPIPDVAKRGDLVWIGNWGAEERTDELKEFLIDPVAELSLTARAYGVRYPKYSMPLLRDAGIDYGGWLANYEVPEIFAQYRATVHIPRRPYARTLPGIPSIRVFEALACGIPLVSAPWEDVEELFEPGKDYLVARTGREMTNHLKDLLNDTVMARELAESGRRTIHARHTCAHRVDELLSIYADYKRKGRTRSEGVRDKHRSPDILLPGVKRDRQR
jgi:spore maturation protein CgeB